MSSRTADTKHKDTIEGTRAELLCAISWVATTPADTVLKTTEEEDWKYHIDYKTSPSNITFDVKSRRFHNYGKSFHPDQNFVAEIENRNPNNISKSGSIYGEQKYMFLEVAGGFWIISTKEIRDYVKDVVLRCNIIATRMDSLFESVYTYDDGAKITALSFNTFPNKKLLSLPEKFKARQFEYTPMELENYIKTNNLKIQL